MKKTTVVSAALIFGLFLCFVGYSVLSGSSAQEIKKPVPSPYKDVSDSQAQVLRVPFNMAHSVPLAKDCPKGKELKVDSIKGPYFDIQSAIDASNPGDKIKVKEGVYCGFIVENTSCLEIEGENDKTIVSGSVTGQDGSRGPYKTTIFVKNSDEIIIKNFTVRGGLKDNYGVWYTSCSGTIDHCDISATADNSGAPAVYIEGISRAANVTVKHSYIHDFGKIGIAVLSSRFLGTRAKIEHNEIMGRIFADPNRVQDGIQINWGAYAAIKHNKIYDCNSTATPPKWSSDGILVSEGIVDSEHNEITNCYEGIYTYGYKWYGIPILNSKHDKIEQSTDCGLILEGTEENTLIEDAKINYNTYGLYQFNYGLALDPVIGNFKNCDLRNNYELDVIQDTYLGSVVLNFLKVKYDTYYLVEGGLGTATLNILKK